MANDKKTLTYTIVNAHPVTIERNVEIDGQAAVATFTRAEVEAEPQDRAGKTIAFVIDDLGDFAPGMDITVTVEAA